MNTIMIIEDDSICVDYLKMILGDHDSQIVSITQDSQMSIRDYKRLQPSIVLVDILLQGKESGIDIVKKLKQFDPLVKIIFLTSYSNNELIDLALEYKVYGYILKPVQKDELIATIKLSTVHQEIALPRQHSHSIQLKNAFIFHFKKAILTYKDKEVSLSSNEKKLLVLLGKNINYTVSITQISHYIWKEDRPISTIRSLIFRLNLKLGKGSILSSSNYGYILQGGDESFPNEEEKRFY